MHSSVFYSLVLCPLPLPKDSCNAIFQVLAHCCFLSGVSPGMHTVPPFLPCMHLQHPVLYVHNTEYQLGLLFVFITLCTLFFLIWAKVLRLSICVTLSFDSSSVLPSCVNYFPFHALHLLCKGKGNSFCYCSNCITICKVLITISASRLTKSILAVTNIIVCLMVLEPKFQKSRNPLYLLMSSAYRTVHGA